MFMAFESGYRINILKLKLLEPGGWKKSDSSDNYV